MPPSVKQQFGSNLRRLRKAAGYSQDSFALHAELHRTYIGGIERGERNVSLENIVKLARALNIPASELMHDVG